MCYTSCIFPFKLTDAIFEFKKPRFIATTSVDLNLLFFNKSEVLQFLLSRRGPVHSIFSVILSLFHIMKWYNHVIAEDSILTIPCISDVQGKF